MSFADPYYACLYTGKKIALRKKMELVTEFKDVSVFRVEVLVLFTCVWIICLLLNSLYIVNFFPVLKSLLSTRFLNILIFCISTIDVSPKIMGIVFVVTEQVESMYRFIWPMA